MDILFQDTQKNPVHLACIQGSVDMLEVMFALQPDRKHSAMEQNDVSGHTPLHKAVLFDKAKAATYLLEQVGNCTIVLASLAVYRQCCSVCSGY